MGTNQLNTGYEQLKSEYELTGYKLTWITHNQFTCITLFPPRVLSLWLWALTTSIAASGVRTSPELSARHIGAV